MLGPGLLGAEGFQLCVEAQGVVLEENAEVRDHLLGAAHVLGHDRDDEGIRGIDDAGGVVPVGVFVVDVAAVLLRHVVYMHLVGQAEVMSLLGLEQIVQHLGEAVGVVIEGLHDLGHIAGGEVAVEHVALVILVDARVLLGLLAPDLVPALAVDEEAAHGVGVVVVGMDKDIVVHGIEVQTADLRIFADLTVAQALGEDHHQRHLVHAAGVEPGIAVEEPLVAGGGVAEADAHPVLADALARKVIVHHFFDGGAVEDAALKDGGGRLRRC